MQRMDVRQDRRRAAQQRRFAARLLEQGADRAAACRR
jgi:hypothetical protein